MELILKRNLKNFFSVLSVDLFMFWKGKLQGLDHRNQVMLEFPGAEMNVLREPSQATEEGGNERGGVTRNPDESTYSRILAMPSSPTSFSVKGLLFYRILPSRVRTHSR